MKTIILPNDWGVAAPLLSIYANCGIGFSSDAPEKAEFENCLFHNLEKIFNFFNPPNKEKMAIDPISGALIGKGVDAASQFGGMMLQNYYQKQAETRANEEWERRFSLENEYNSPSAQAERLVKAGINPLSQLSGTAPTPSASGSTNNPQSPSQQIDVDFAEIAFQAKRLENETKVADAQARNLIAQAKATSSAEEQSWWKTEFERQRLEMEKELQPHKINEIVQRISESKERENYQKVMNYIADKTKDIKVESERISLQELREARGTALQTLENLKKDGKIKDAIYNTTVAQLKAINGQIFSQEIANTLGVFEFERLTGRSYYNPSVKVGPGLWDIEDATALNEKILSDYGVEDYDVNLMLDRLVDIVDIADVINDDIFQWKSQADKEKFQNELLSYKKKTQKERHKGNNTQIFLTLLPYILKLVNNA